MAAQPLPYFSGEHHKSGGGGISGFVENFAKDVADAAKGTPEGLVQLVEHPVRTVEGMGKVTWQTWSPLFTGHVGTFGKEFYAHPLAPLLDIATVFTGGAAVAARFGAVAADAGLISETSALAKLAKMPTKLEIKPTADAVTRTKYLPKNPLHNATYRTMYRIVNSSQHIPDWFSGNVFGEKALYRRLEAVDRAHAVAATNAQIAAFLKAGQLLDDIGKHPVTQVQIHKDNYLRMLDHAPEITLKQAKEHGLPEGYNYVKAWRPEDGGDKMFHGMGNAAKTFEEFRDHLYQNGRNFTTKNLEHAVVSTNEHGEQVVKIARLKEWSQEAHNSATMLRTLYRAPVKVWKAVLLGYSPRVVINNGVGNWLMYAMRQGGSHSLQGFVDAVRYTRGQKAVEDLFKETGKLHEHQHFIDKYFADEMGNTFIDQVAGHNRTLRSGPFYPLVHTFADQPVRAAAISAFLRGAPEVRALMDKGLSFEKAADEALSASKELRDRAALHARSVAGDYVTITRLEGAIRDIVPFYLWDKHIVMHSLAMLRDRPAVVTAGVALGQQGATATRNQLGSIPDYMIGLVPVGHLHGNPLMLSTLGMNPYSTVPDLVDVAQSLTVGGGENGGEAVLGETNPIVSGLIEQIMGQTPTGRKVNKHGGVISSVLTDTTNSLPAVQLLRQAAGLGPKSSNPRLYKRDINSVLAALVGVPLKETDLEHAHDLAVEQATGKRPSKKNVLPVFTG